MTSTRPHWMAIGALTLALLAMILWHFSPETQTMADGRTAVYLSSDERQMVLGEMRHLLMASQEVIKGLAENDLLAVEQAALKVGTKAITTVDMKLAPKLPAAFRKLGFGTHGAFDEIAQMAKAKQPVQSIQLQLVKTMNNCIACHAAYQLPAFRPAP